MRYRRPVRGRCRPSAIEVVLQDRVDRIVGACADLERSGLFKPIDPKAFISVEKSMDQVPQFNNWRVLKAQALTQGSIVPEGGDRLRVQFRLWDVFGEQQLTGQVYTTVRSNWRRIAHIIADAIYKRLTGEDGYFDTRIVYISESGPEQRRVKRAALDVLDQLPGLGFPQFKLQFREPVLQQRENPRQQIGRQRGNHPERQPSGQHAFGPEDRQAVFEAARAIGDLGEILHAELLLLRGEGAVIGRNHLQRARCEPRPKAVLM